MNENTQQPAATAHSEESRQWEECVAKLSLDEGTSNTVSLYTSDAADDLLCVDLGGRRILKKKNNSNKT